MKKGLFSILAGALLVVGCQNYDDQFTKLEANINALAAQVAGLSEVQSDLTALAGQVNSLQTSVGETVNTALADGLADIDTAVASLEAATETAASAADVANIASSIESQQEDLQTLLDNASIFQGNVIINSVATLGVYEKMGSSINIVNGYATISVTADMDMVKVQSVVDNIFTTVLDFTYTSPSSDIAEVKFTKLTGTQSLTVTQAGGYDFRNLTSATNVVLGNAFKSSIRVIHFGALLNATSFTTGTTANSIVFNKATELHLTSLKRFTTSSSAPLTLEIDEGSVLLLTALDDVATDGTQEDIYLSITGPSSFTATKFTDGSLTFTDVATVVVNDFVGTIVTGGGVESFTANKLVDAYTMGVDIETLNVTGLLDPDVTTDQSGPAITSTSDNLESATIAGNITSIALSGARLETVVVTADVAGAITLSASARLTTVTLTGSKATGVTVDDCDQLVTLTVDTTIQKGRSTTAAKTAALKLNGTVVLKDSKDITTLTISSSDLAVLTITGNGDLNSITGTGIAKIGATAASNKVNIYSNDLTATKSNDLTNTAATLTADGKVNDLGKYTTTSGIATFKTYLDLVAKNTAATANVHFDTIESVQTNGTEGSTDKLYANTADRGDTYILVVDAGSGDGTPAGAAIKAKRAFIVDLATTGTFGAQLTDKTELFATGTAPTTAVSETIESNSAFMLASLQNDANVSRFGAYGITIASSFVANATLTVSLVQYFSAAVSQTVSGERYVTGDTAITANAGGGFTAVGSATNFGMGIDDLMTFTVAGNSVTVSPNTGGATTLAGLADDVVAAWATKYGYSGTASGSAVATMTAVAGVITVVPLDKGTAGTGLAIAMSVKAGTVTATNAKNIDYVIGASVATTDNGTVATDVLITLTHNGTGADVTGQISFTGNAVASMPVEMITTKRTNSVGADALNPYVLAQQPADAVATEGGSAAVAATTAATSDNRVGWLN